MQRVYEIAREHRLTSRQVMDELRRLGYPAHSYATPVTEEEARELRAELARRVKERSTTG